MQKIFLYDNVNNRIELNVPEILLIREFKALMDKKRNITPKDKEGKLGTQAFKEFTFLVFSGQRENVDVYLGSNVINVSLQIPALYDLTAEYVLLAEMARKPKVYEVEKWLTLSDIRNLRFFKQYFIHPTIS